jgi:hypothetical protein
VFAGGVSLAALSALPPPPHAVISAAAAQARAVEAICLHRPIQALELFRFAIIKLLIDLIVLAQSLNPDFPLGGALRLRS